LDRDYHRRRRAGAGAGGTAQNGGDHDHEEGSLWRYYAELATKKKRRELALEQARAFHGDRFDNYLNWARSYGDFASGNGNDFAPLPAGPWHAPGPTFPEYDWGPGIGGGAGLSPPPPGPLGPPPTSVVADGRWVQYPGPSVVGGPRGGGGFVPDDPGDDWKGSNLQRW